MINNKIRRDFTELFLIDICTYRNFDADNYLDAYDNFYLYQETYLISLYSNKKVNA